MRKFLRAFREWHRPRRHHSLVTRWWRNAVLMLPFLPLLHSIFPGPWYDGLGSVIWYSLAYALGEYGYFHVYGGTETEYPELPKNFRIFL
jgi:hypothetical protein